MKTYQELLSDPEWVAKNEKALKDIFPETFTHVSNLNILQIGFKFKLLGLDWRSQEQMADVMATLEKRRIILRDGHTIKRNPH